MSSGVNITKSQQAMGKHMGDELEISNAWGTMRIVKTGVAAWLVQGCAPTRRFAHFPSAFEYAINGLRDDGVL